MRRPPDRKLALLLAAATLMALASVLASRSSARAAGAADDGLIARTFVRS
ncbi:MAG TPA: hypothetical protein VE935_11860 [Burkholderiales bacterium]|jgi:hypothetical protein|nr:hypothetical protein [Burkholderiales bacterium]